MDTVTLKENYPTIFATSHVKGAVDGIEGIVKWEVNVNVLSSISRLQGRTWIIRKELCNHYTRH